MTLQILKPGDKQWRKFGKLLKEELLFSKECDAISFSLSEKILQKHFPEYDIEKTFEFFMTHRACCDCEVLYNVYMNLPGKYEHGVNSASVRSKDEPDDFLRRIADPYAPHSKNFPYLVERMIPGVYNIIPRSADTSIDDLVAEAKDIIAERKTRVCVVLGPKRGLYVEPDGSVNESESIPSGGFPLQVEFKKTRHRSFRRSFRHQRTR
jgi:hypothetical protein